jgi:D-alanyl-D-alanine carboxypeptidase
MPSGSAPVEAAAPERVSLLDNARKKGKAAMNAAADGVRAGLATVAVYVGRAPGWSGPVAQARPANTPVGTPPPVTAYAPEIKPAVLDGSAPPIAASAADALPTRRATDATAKRSAKALAAREDADPDVNASPKVKPAAKHAKAAHHRRHVRTADGRHGGKHKRLAAAKPVAQGDGGGKPPAPAHSARRPEGE